jgi:diadenosine tetraphosphate (Ap4A) HIT family hydrolase
MALRDECYSCLANAGTRPISPGPRILEGRYWNLEHAYPTGLLGWLVVVLKRHARALHELSPEETGELGEITVRAAAALHESLGTESEYLALFAETKHFRHVHVHVIPRAADLAPDLRGPKVFSYLAPAEGSSLPTEQVDDLCRRLRERLTPPGSFRRPD